MEGFEPPVPSRVHRISSAARSTTLAHLRGKDKLSLSPDNVFQKLHNLITQHERMSTNQGCLPARMKAGYSEIRLWDVRGEWV